MTNQLSDIRNYYLRMPKELHDKVMMISLLNRRTLKEEILLALEEHVEKQEEQSQEATIS